MVVHLHIPVVSAGGFFDAFYAESMPRLSDFPVAGVMRFEEQARFHPLKFLARIAEEVEVCGQTKVLRVEDHRVETDRASERRPGADGVQEEVKGKGSVTVQPRTLHLLQSP